MARQRSIGDFHGITRIESRNWTALTILLATKRLTLLPLHHIIHIRIEIQIYTNIAQKIYLSRSLSLSVLSEFINIITLYCQIGNEWFSISDSEIREPFIAVLAVFVAVAPAIDRMHTSWYSCGSKMDKCAFRA